MNKQAAKELAVSVALVALASISFISQHIPVSADNGLERVFGLLLRSFVFLAIVPALFIVWYRRESLRSIGFGPPAPGTHPVRLIVVACAITLPIGLLLATTQEFTAYYGLGAVSIFQFVLRVIVLPAAYYSIEELFFRGFLLWRLDRSLGTWRAILYSNLLFTIAHISKPAFEIPFALFVGLTLSFIAYRTKSFVPAAIVHFVLALGVTIVATLAGGSSTPFHF